MDNIIQRTVDKHVLPYIISGTAQRTVGIDPLLEFLSLCVIVIFYPAYGSRKGDFGGKVQVVVGDRCNSLVGIPGLVAIVIIIIGLAGSGIGLEILG